jgi:hypothetical protein
MYVLQLYERTFLFFENTYFTVYCIYAQKSVYTECVGFFVTITKYSNFIFCCANIDLVSLLLKTDR